VAQALKRFVTDEDGADLIEYALMVGLLAMACFVALSSLGTTLTTFFSSVITKVASIAP